MLQKFLGSKTKVASQLLRKINMCPNRAHLLTQLADIGKLFGEPTTKLPSINTFIKVLKKGPFSLNYILKCSILLHFFLQSPSKNTLEHLHHFLTFLKGICHGLEESLGLIQTTGNATKTINLSCPTQSDEILTGKEGFILKEIIYPYLCYLTKLTVIKDQQGENLCEENWRMWRWVNLLKSISSFTVKFMTIGRYYLRQYGAITVLLSQILSIDIHDYVTEINSYLERQFKMLCFCSSGREERREIDDFARFLEEMGCLNERFSQFYMGKYFFQYLQHIRKPEWLDNNSPQFDRVFSKKPF